MGGRRIVFAVFAVVAAAAWWQAGDFGVKAGLLPHIASGGMFVLALLGLFFSKDEGADRERAGPRSLTALGSFAAYGVLMPVLGFLATTAIVCVAFVAGVGGMRTAWRWSLLCVAFAVAVYAAFTSLFMVSFPAGILR